jgi:parvulin-like peptidyl-prolyl isomerase
MRNSFVFSVCCVSLGIFAERVIVDEIRTVVYNEDGARIILSSDIKPDLDGRPRSLYDVVCEEVLVCEADRMHIKVTQEDVERYLGELQKNNNMTRSAMERAMDEMGYTYAQGMEKLRRRQMGEQLVDHRVRSDARFVIPDEDIKKFDDENPTYEQAVYTLADTLVAEDGSDVMHKNFSPAELNALSWEEPFEVKERDLAENMQYVADAKVGDIVLREPAESKSHVEIIRLVAKKPRRRVALDEVIEPISKKTLSDKIADVIRMKRFEELLKEYYNELLDKATMRFSYDKDRTFVIGK